MNDQVLRIGILADDTVTSSYVHDLVVWGRAQANIRIDHLIVHAPPKAEQASARRGLRARLASLLFRAVVKLERLRLARSGKFPRHGQMIDLRPLVETVVSIAPRVSASGVVFRFDDAEVERVKALRLDLLIRAGGGILRGGILSASRLGILSFHHADNRINRGMPAAFWEVFHQQDTTGFTLQRLTEELDGGDVLMRGRFPTRHYYQLNQAALYEKSNHYLKLLLGRVAASGDLPAALPSTPYSRALYRAPRSSETIGYMARFLKDAAGKRIRRLRGREYQWQVSFTPAPWRQAVLWRARTIPNPRGRYLADPFVIERDGRTCCFVEDYDCSTKRGRISVYELNSGGSSEFLGPVVEEPFHLSFPYVFEHDGELYMCPESSANRDIRVYRCTGFPLEWRLEKVIMSDVRAADTMLFEKDRCWWMLTNIDTADTGDYCSDLFVFRSDSPLSDQWTPHAGNPVVLDAGYARNAGLLREGTRLYRVSQRQGFDQYGKGSQINEIVALSDSSYEENCVAQIEPAFHDGIIGTHHMHCSGRMTVVDSLKLSPIVP